MIAKIMQAHSRADRTAAYCWQRVELGQGEWIPAGTMAARSGAEAVAELREWRDLTGIAPGALDSLHVVISLPPGEALSPEQWAQVVTVWAEELGYADCPWQAVRHDDTDHQHVHVIGLRYGPDGRRVRCWQDRPRSREVCDRLERELQLSPALARAPHPGRRSPPTHELRDTLRHPSGLDPRAETWAALESARERAKDLPELALELNSKSIRLVPNVSRTSERIAGLRYVHTPSGRSWTARELGAEAGLGALAQAGVEQGPIELLRGLQAEDRQLGGRTLRPPEQRALAQWQEWRAARDTPTEPAPAPVAELEEARASRWARAAEDLIRPPAPAERLPVEAPAPAEDLAGASWARLRAEALAARAPDAIALARALRSEGIHLVPVLSRRRGGRPRAWRLEHVGASEEWAPPAGLALGEGWRPLLRGAVAEARLRAGEQAPVERGDLERWRARVGPAEGARREATTAPPGARGGHVAQDDEEPEIQREGSQDEEPEAGLEPQIRARLQVYEPEGILRILLLGEARREVDLDPLGHWREAVPEALHEEIEETAERALGAIEDARVDREAHWPGMELPSAEADAEEEDHGSGSLPPVEVEPPEPGSRRVRVRIGAEGLDRILAVDRAGQWRGLVRPGLRPQIEALAQEARRERGSPEALAQEARRALGGILESEPEVARALDQQAERGAPAPLDWPTTWVAARTDEPGLERLLAAGHSPRALLAEGGDLVVLLETREDLHHGAAEAAQSLLGGEIEQGQGRPEWADGAELLVTLPWEGPDPRLEAQAEWDRPAVEPAGLGETGEPRVALVGRAQDQVVDVDAAGRWRDRVSPDLHEEIAHEDWAAEQVTEPGAPAREGAPAPEERTAELPTEPEERGAEEPTAREREQWEWEERQRERGPQPEQGGRERERDPGPGPQPEAGQRARRQEQEQAQEVGEAPPLPPIGPVRPSIRPEDGQIPEPDQLETRDEIGPQPRTVAVRRDEEAGRHRGLADRARWISSLDAIEEPPHPQVLAHERDRALTAFSEHAAERAAEPGSTSELGADHQAVLRRISGAELERLETRHDVALCLADSDPDRPYVVAMRHRHGIDAARQGHVAAATADLPGERVSWQDLRLPGDGADVRLVWVSPVGSRALDGTIHDRIEAADRDQGRAAEPQSELRQAPERQEREPEQPATEPQPREPLRAQEQRQPGEEISQEEIEAQRRAVQALRSGRGREQEHTRQAPEAPQETRMRWPWQRREQAEPTTETPEISEEQRRSDQQLYEDQRRWMEERQEDWLREMAPELEGLRRMEEEEIEAQRREVARLRGDRSRSRDRDRDRGPDLDD